MLQQLSLPLALRDDTKFENFYVSSANQYLYDYLQEFAKQAASERLLYLYGETGSGKTHLLQAICQKAANTAARVFYLPLYHAKQFWDPDILEDLHDLDLLAIDDIDEIAGNIIWEKSLFYLLHRLLVTHQVPVVFSARHLPQSVDFVMPELSSRLANCLSLKVENLSDEEKVAALQLHAEHKGLLLGDQAAQYLVKWAAGNSMVLFKAFDALDLASLQAQRRITVPFIKQCMQRRVISHDV